VWAAGAKILITDEGSANGTIVNGRRVGEAHSLVDGDRIRLGDVEAVYYSGPVPEPDPSSPGFPVTDSAGERTTPVVAATTGTQTTRLLCAAVHLDRRFRQHVLDATVRETFRAVAPSPGVDLSVVARHAVLAERRGLMRDGALAAIIGVTVAVVLVELGSGDVRGSFERRDWEGLTSDAGWLLPIGCGLLLAAWGVETTETWVRLSTLARYVRPGGHPEKLPLPTAARTARVLEELAGVSTGNVIVYSVYEPFVGSGVAVDATSYSIPLLPADDGENGRRPARFRAGELMADLTHALRELELENVRVDRRLYLDGYAVARLPALLPDPRSRPTAWVPTPLLDRFTEQPTGSVRPYLCVEITGWRGQLVVTTFVRVVVLTGILFVESAACVLPPLRREYFAIDAMRIRTTSERVTRTLLEGTARTVPALLASPVRLGTATAVRRRAASRRRDFHRKLRDQVRVDRGARTSLRKEASRSAFSSYFMQLDAEMAFSVVQQRVADVVAGFLGVHGYRTDKISIIQNQITNTTLNDNSFQVGNISGNAVGIGHHSSGTISGSSAGGDGRRR
jgi:hypothetical protein